MAVGYPAGMARFRTRWVVAAFIVLGALLALWLIVRDIGTGDGPEENGTLPSSGTP
jgi:hypothetical protein